MALNPHKHLSALAAFLPSLLFGKPAARGYSSDKEYRSAASAFAFLAVLSLFFTGEAKAQPEAFIITVKTDNPGSSNSRSFTIPTTGTGYNYEVDWDDDGTYDQFGITGNATHSYGAAGIYTLRIRGTFPRIYFNASGDYKKILDVKQWGNVAWTSMENAFVGCSNMDITATDLPNLSEVRNMDYMFAYCTILDGPANIGDWNTANVTSMVGMFNDAYAFNQPIGNWNTANVTTMKDMFWYARAFNQPIGNWNTANVTSMARMFYNATAFNQPIGNWNTANVKGMLYMFKDATNFNQPIGNWNTANVTDMRQMFFSAHAFNQPIGNWNTAAVTSMEGMFYDAIRFNQPIGDWNTANVKDMNFMFAYAEAFNQPIGNWNTENVEFMRNMFFEAYIFNQPIGNWNTKNVKNMENMFLKARAFNQPIETWNVESVTDMSSMFKDAAVFNQPIGKWNTESVTDMNGMFQNARAFNQSLGAWYLNPGASMQLLLNNCGMDCANYSATLNGWANNPDTPSDRWLGAVGRKYGANILSDRNALVSIKSWRIDGDAAHDASCPFTSSTATAPVDGGAVVLSPNPADKEVYIRLITPNPSTNQLTAPSIAIFDMQGRLVWKQQEAATPEQPLRIAVSDWTPGVYMVVLRGGGTVVTKRLVVLE